MIHKANNFYDIQNYLNTLSKNYPILQNQEDFAFWLAGYFNQHGNFPTATTKILKISLQMKDPALLKLIQQNLGFGQISSTLEHRRLSFTSKEKLLFFIDLMNSLSFSEKRQNSLSNLLHAFNSKYQTNILCETPKENWFKETSFFKPFFTGFFEASCSPFSFYYHSSSHSFSPAIRIYSNYSKSLVQKFKDSFNINNQNGDFSIFFNGTEEIAKKFNRTSSSYYDIPTIEPFINFITTTTLYGNKKKQLQNFNIIVNKIKNFEELVSADEKDFFWEELCQTFFDFVNKFSSKLHPLQLPSLQKEILAKTPSNFQKKYKK